MAAREASPPLWGGTARKAHAKAAKRECLLRPKGPRPPPLTDTRRQQGGRPEVRLEAAPLPSPTPPAGGGGAARGPRQNERRGPAHHERPSLIWRGLSPSPGERHITTSISPGRAREEPRRGEGGPAKTITTGACFSFTGPPSSSSSSSPSSAPFPLPELPALPTSSQSEQPGLPLRRAARI